MRDIDDANAVRSLGQKLDGLELTDPERAALHALFDAAGIGEPKDEVGGFMLVHEHQNPFSARLGLVLQFDEADAIFAKRNTGFIGETEKNLYPGGS